MDLINRQVSRAARLLWTQTILNILSWCLIVSFTACFVAMLVPKIWFFPYTFSSWSTSWLVGSAVVSGIVTLSIALLYRPSKLHSAMELDRRFGLRERISSALQMEPNEQLTNIGDALLKDATAKAEKIDVRDHFPVRSAPQTPWVMLPFVACLALFWVPDAENGAIAKLPDDSNSERLNNIKNQTRPILNQIKKQRQVLEEKGLQEAADEFKKLEKKLEDIQKANTLNSKKLLSDFNEIKKEMEQRKESLGGSDSLKKALDTLKNMDKGPAEKIADALKDGDFEKAGSELEKMLEQMKSGKVTDDQKKQLTKQLEQMQKALEKSLENQQNAVEEAKNELAKAKNAGDVETAAKLQKKLEQLQANAKQAKAVQAVQANLQKAQKAMEQGDEKAAQQALEELQGEMGQLAEDQESLQEMEEMMEDLKNAKSSSACSECDGGGCSKCKSDKESKPNKNGKGEGKGSGDREESESDVKNFDSQVREEMRKGETVYGGKVGGRNRKGATKEDVRDAVLSATPDDPDAIENMTLPKAQRDQQRDYFNSIRDK